MEYDCLMHPFIASRILDIKEDSNVPVTIEVKGCYMGLKHVIMTFEEKYLTLVNLMRDTAIDEYFQKYEQAELAESENV